MDIEMERMRLHLKYVGNKGSSTMVDMKTVVGRGRYDDTDEGKGEQFENLHHGLRYRKRPMTQVFLVSSASTSCFTYASPTIFVTMISVTSMML